MNQDVVTLQPGGGDRHSRSEITLDGADVDRPQKGPKAFKRMRFFNAAQYVQSVISGQLRHMFEETMIKTRGKKHMTLELVFAEKIDRTGGILFFQKYIQNGHGGLNYRELLNVILIGTYTGDVITNALCNLPHQIQVPYLVVKNKYAVFVANRRHGFLSRFARYFFNMENRLDTRKFY